MLWKRHIGGRLGRKALSSQNEPDEVLTAMVHTLGKLPDDWAQLPFRKFCGLLKYGDPAAGKTWQGFNEPVEYPLIKMILDIQDDQCMSDSSDAENLFSGL